MSKILNSYSKRQKKMKKGCIKKNIVFSFTGLVNDSFLYLPAEGKNNNFFDLFQNSFFFFNLLHFMKVTLKNVKIITLNSFFDFFLNYY